MPHRWLYVTVTSPSALAAELLAEGLLVAGASGVVEEGERLATWYPPPDDPDRFIATLRSDLAGAIGSDPELHWEWRADADWIQEWRRGLAARHVGDRIIVTPSWITPAATADHIVITVDPQMAFGTGEHATTRGVLCLMEPVVRAGDVVLDVGTGSGILAIAAVKLGATHVDAVESDADALINAEENVHGNGVAARIALVHGLVDAPWLQARAARYHIILANVLSSVLRPLLPHFRAALTPGGHLILSGILQAEAEAMQEAASAAGFALVREDREEEWWTGLLRRP